MAFIVLGAFDHPFLKIHSGMNQLSIANTDQPKTVAKGTKEEEDMAYFERRYQQRVSLILVHLLLF